MAIETGLSDFHKMKVTVMKSQYQKQKPKIISYRKYKNFYNELFREELFKKNEDNREDMSLDKLQQTLINVLDKHAPMKHKYTRANQAPFMNKFLQNKAVMNRSRLKNKYLRNKTSENWEAYKKQRNTCVYMFRKGETN